MARPEEVCIGHPSTFFSGVFAVERFTDSPLRESVPRRLGRGYSNLSSEDFHENACPHALQITKCWLSGTNMTM